MAISIRIRVQPKARQEKVVEIREGELKIYTRQPAVNGKANKAVKRMLADFLHIKHSKIEIIKGIKSRDKVVRLRD